MTEAMPTAEEWADWLSHPCTKRLRYWADKQRYELMEQWAAGEFSAAFTTEMAVKNAGATGACSVFVDLIDPDYEKIVIGASDDIKEQKRTDTVGPGSSG